MVDQSSPGINTECFFQDPPSPLDKILKPGLPVWQALKDLTRFMHQVVQPGIRGEVEKGAVVDKHVHLAAGAKVESGAVIKGPSYIGPGTLVRSGAYIRELVWVGPDCIVGFGTELLRTMVLGNCKMPHHVCLMQSLVGKNVRFQAYVAVASIPDMPGEIQIKMDRIDTTAKIATGMQRLGAVIGDDCMIGGMSFMLPGSLLTQGLVIKPHSLVQGYNGPSTANY
jgi:NDP-sugar pyrophosphorylase family protein